MSGKQFPHFYFQIFCIFQINILLCVDINIVIGRCYIIYSFKINREIPIWSEVRSVKSCIWMVLYGLLYLTRYLLGLDFFCLVGYSKSENYSSFKHSLVVSKPALQKIIIGKNHLLTGKAPYCDLWYQPDGFYLCYNRTWCSSFLLIMYGMTLLCHSVYLKSMAIIIVFLLKYRSVWFRSRKTESMKREKNNYKHYISFTEKINYEIIYVCLSFFCMLL